jgi:hypothetical protein
MSYKYKERFLSLNSREIETLKYFIKVLRRIAKDKLNKAERITIKLLRVKVQRFCVI